MDINALQCSDEIPCTHSTSSVHTARSLRNKGASDPDPDLAGYPVNLMDPAGSNVSGSGLDPDPAGSEVGPGKYWPDPHNYDIKHQSIF